MAFQFIIDLAQNQVLYFHFLFFSRHFAKSIVNSYTTKDNT